MRLLLVEDDLKIVSFISKGLRQAGFAVDAVNDGEEGLRLALSEPYDIAIIDIMLPLLDGLTLIERVRRQKLDLPVLILSAKSSVDDRVKGLQSGGDDYLIKPFAFSELLARVYALLRRPSIAMEPTRIAVGDLSIDLLTHKAIRANVYIDIQPREFALLEYLMRNAGRIVSKTMIMEHVWDYNFDPQTNIIEVSICRLREKIDRPYDKKMIYTVRGVGYALKEPL